MKKKKHKQGNESKEKDFSDDNSGELEEMELEEIAGGIEGPGGDLTLCKHCMTRVAVQGMEFCGACYRGRS
ncbi:hypothetical protein [Salibacterium sp. K-3]